MDRAKGWVPRMGSGWALGDRVAAAGAVMLAVLTVVLLVKGP